MNSSSQKLFLAFDSVQIFGIHSLEIIQKEKQI